jgi:hypothetical protein
LYVLEPNVAAPKYLWVKYGKGDPVAVATEGCDFVSLFIGAIRKNMPKKLDVDVDEITLHVSEDAASLDPRWSLLKVIQEYGVSEESILIVKIRTQGILRY